MITFRPGYDRHRVNQYIEDMIDGPYVLTFIGDGQWAISTIDPKARAKMEKRGWEVLPPSILRDAVASLLLEDAA